MKTSSRVLLVEDSEKFRAFICSALGERPELQIVGEVSDGLQAVRTAEELRPDLILLDIALPSMNGLEVARQILKLSPNSKILFVSQESSAEVVREALGTGAHGFVVKIDAGSELLILNVGQNKAENRIVVVSRSQRLNFPVKLWWMEVMIFMFMIIVYS